MSITPHCSGSQPNRLAGAFSSVAMVSAASAVFRCSFRIRFGDLLHEVLTYITNLLTKPGSFALSRVAAAWALVLSAQSVCAAPAPQASSRKERFRWSRDRREPIATLVGWRTPDCGTDAAKARAKSARFSVGAAQQGLCLSTIAPRERLRWSTNVFPRGAFLWGTPVSRCCWSGRLFPDCPELPNPFRRPCMSLNRSDLLMFVWSPWFLVFPRWGFG
jgi:hypothetical protein